MVWHRVGLSRTLLRWGAGCSGPGFGRAGGRLVLIAALHGACVGLVTAAGLQKVSRPLLASVSLSGCPPICPVPQTFSSSANTALYSVTIDIFTTLPLSGTIPVF